MAAVIVVVVLTISVMVGFMVWTSVKLDERHTEPPPTEAEILQAKLDMHRIERGVDVALASREVRREAERTKRAITDALEDDGR